MLEFASSNINYLATISKQREVASEKKTQQVRERITPAVVDQAIAAAKKATDSGRIADWNDTERRYLTLRQRGRSVRWIVRAYGLSRKIGSATGIHVDPTCLSLRDAREKAKQIYADMAGGKLDEAPPAAAPQVPKPATWTWADLDRGYQAMITKPRWVNRRTKPVSKGTCDDVRLAFAKEVAQNRATGLNVSLQPDKPRPAIGCGDVGFGEQAADRAGLTVIGKTLIDTFLPNHVVCDGKRHQLIKSQIAIAIKLHQSWRN